MELLVKNVVLLVMLAVSAVEDIRKKKISLIWIGIFAAAGIVGNIFWESESIWSLVGGVCVGILLLGISRVTHGEIGLGDGCIICVIGVYLGFFKNMELLLTALLLAAVCAIILVLLRKAGRKTELPFVPFLCMAHILVWTLEG